MGMDLGLSRSGRKFAIVAVTSDRFDIGFKLDKDAVVVDGVTPAGPWNSMVSHRATLGADDDLSDDHLRLLTSAYQRAGR